MNILVLGSEGVIGNSFCKYIENLNNPNLKVIRWDIKLNPKRHDLRNPDNNSELLLQINKCDYILFSAFDVGGAKYIYDTNSESLINNMAIMANVFPLIKDKKFIFLSTYMIYCTDNYYGLCKKLGELYTTKNNGMIVRLWNVYGEEQCSLKSHVITDFIKSSLNKREINILSDGSEYRQFLHQKDCAEGLYNIFNNYEKYRKDNNLIELTSNVWTSVLELCDIISEFIPNIKITKGTLNNLHKKVNPTNLLLDWTPKITLKEGIKDLIDKHKNHQHVNNLNIDNLNSIINTTLYGKGDSDKHLMTLFSLVLQLNAKNILELGVRNGSTTYPLLCASELVNGRVTSVDIECTDFNCPSTLSNRWTFINSDSIQFLHNHKSDKPWDLVYIDDWHSYDHVKKELELLDKQISPSTIIVLHDLMYANYEPRYHSDMHVKTGQWANGGPYRAVCELDTNFWEFSTIPICNGLTILRKKYSGLYFKTN